MDKDVLYQCINGHRFIVGERDMEIGVDGIGCIECGRSCGPMGYAKNYQTDGLRIYVRGNKRSKLSNLTVSLDMNTDKLIKKLQAISKHTQALANELEQIDKDVCPQCGDGLDIDNYFDDCESVISVEKCKSCSYMSRK